MSGRKPLGNDNERFWAKVDTSGGPDACWPWTGHRMRRTHHQHPYGVFYIKNRFMKRNFYAHRLSWEYLRGPIPEGLCVLHRCDNPPCVNPTHLFLGTMADNTADMIAKGRAWHQKPTHGRRYRGRRASQ